MARVLASSLLVAALLGACALDFDFYDPRLSETAGGGTSAVTTTGSTVSSQSSAQSSAGAGGAATGGAGGNGGAGGAVPPTISYTPTVADCVLVADPNPDNCVAVQRPNTIGVDLSSSTQEIHSYLRFDFDNQLAGKRVTAVTLELTVNATVLDAESDASGEVHEVSSFTHQSLFGTLPTALGLLAADQGPNVLGRTVQWSLPAGVVAADGSLFLGILPTSTDGIDYDSLTGAVPPRLLVTVE